MSVHRLRNSDSNSDDDSRDVATPGERLQKMMAAAGLGSRRECEELILQGRVEVDGQAVCELGVRVDPLRQRVRVDGVALPQPKRVYHLVNKPAGVLCTNFDPSGRTRVVDLVRSSERLFTVGRLDRTSEGLILVTNDGELANRLTHPRFGVEKVYRVWVAGYPPAPVLQKLLRGIQLSDGVAKAAAIKVKHRYPESTELEMTLREGRNREIRRVLARVGHKVLRLKRVAIGPIRLGDLPLGTSRRLTLPEVSELEAAVKSGAAAELRGPARARRRGSGARRARKGETSAARHTGEAARVIQPGRGGVVLDGGFDEAQKSASGRARRDKHPRKRRP